ncbi:PAS domain-containing protein [Hyphomicrobium sp.]|uniref:PAS domain-containing protein n=1 Tax=Hyphomicrobium sp. TaxID=82 RepID=UPI002FE0DBD7
MAVLGIVFLVVLGTWWDGSLSLKIHMASLTAAMIGLSIVTLTIAVFPFARAGKPLNAQKSDLDATEWAGDIARKLSAPAAVLDDRATVVVANKTFLTELGMHEMSEQIVGMPISNLVYPSDRRTLAKVIATAGRSNLNNAPVALRMLCADGTAVPVHISLSPLHEEGTSELNLLQVSLLSPHRAAGGDAVGDYDCRLLIDRIEQIVFQINPDGELIFLNSSWATLLDHAIQDSLGKPLISFIHPEDRSLVEAHVTALTRGKRNSCHIETRMIGRNGTSYWVVLRARSMSLIKRERTSVIGTFTDVSQMKRTEASLQANRRSLSMLLSNIPGMVYRCKNDRNWSFDFASDGCLDVTGYEPYEIVGDPKFSYVEIIHPEDRVYAWEFVRQQVALRRKFQLIYRIVHRSGAIKWVWEQGKGVFSSTGEPLALEGFITDIASDGDDEAVRGFKRLLLDQHRLRS